MPITFFVMGIFCEIHFYSFLNKRILNQQPVEADGKKAFDNYECKKQKAAKIYFELIAKFEIL